MSVPDLHGSLYPDLACSDLSQHYTYVASDHTAYFFVSLGLFSMAMRIYALNISYKPIILLSRTVNKSGHPLCYPLACSPHSPHIPQPITTTSYTRSPPLAVDVEDAKKRFHIPAVLCFGAWYKQRTTSLTIRGDNYPPVHTTKFSRKLHSLGFRHAGLTSSLCWGTCCS